MSKERKERKRQILLQRKMLSAKRRVEKFLSSQVSFNDYVENSIIQYGEIPAITDTYNGIEINYKELAEQIRNFSAVLQSFGVQKGDFVGIYTENNGRWSPCELAVMKCGAICTLRGSSSPVGELDFIMEHSQMTGVILRNGKLLNELKPYINKHNLKFIILMFKSDKDDFSNVDIPVHYYEDVVEIGKSLEFHEIEQNIEEPCSMLYTSGTTGNPKGVIISHKNLLAQIPGLREGFGSQKGENTLQILPVWHSYEQMAQLYYISGGCHLHFTTLAGLKNDLSQYDIKALMCVPRIWESIRLRIFQKLKQTSHFKYRLFDFGLKISLKYKIHKMYSERRIPNKQTAYHAMTGYYHKFVRSFLKPLHVLFMKTLYKQIKTENGINFRVALSGGGSLSLKDQLFYDAIGVNLREGYGLTETSPILTLRSIREPNLLGSCGRPMPGTEIQVRDIETGEELGIYQKGVVFAKGYQVTKGYYKNDAATKAVFSDDGWFNTGDIGWMTADKDLILVGRMKETIVLSNGENVEPIPIEEACLESPYIDQIVLVGQDEASIGALVVPSEAALEKCKLLANDLKSGSTLSIKDQTLRDLIKKEIATYIKNKQNLKPFEQIKQFEVLNESFRTDNGMMSQTSKIKRNNVFEKYKSTITGMFEKK